MTYLLYKKDDKWYRHRDEFNGKADEVIFMEDVKIPIYSSDGKNFFLNKEDTNCDCPMTLWVDEFENAMPTMEYFMDRINKGQYFIGGCGLKERYNS